MTIAEAMKQGIPFVRGLVWNEYAHLELPKLFDDGTHAPWARLTDPCSNLAMGKPANHKISLLIMPGGFDIMAECEVWQEPLDYRERFGEP